MTSEGSSPFRIEHHGIDAVPKEERRKTWWDLFVIQAGVNITLPTFMIGGILVPSLGWAELVWVLALGHVVLGVLLVLSGQAGVDYGVPTTVLTRFALGYPRGIWLSSGLIMTSLVGWFAVTAELAGLAVDGMLADILGFSSPTLIIVLMGLSCSIPAIVGFESVRWLSWLSVPGLLLLAFWLLAAVLEEQSFSQLIDYQATGEVTFMTGVDWVIGGLIVGVFIASDFSRYVKSRGHNWAGGMMGVIPASVFLGLIGTLSKLSTGDWNPVNAVQALGMGIPALIIILFATWTSNDVNLYSSGIALTNLFPKLERWQSTLLFSVIGTTLAALRITEHFETFLATLAFGFSPLVGVVLCDFFVIRHMKLNLPEAYAPRGELFYARGVNPVAWIAILAGFFFGMALPSDWVASLAGLLLAAASYWVGMRIFYSERFKA